MDNTEAQYQFQDEKAREEVARFARDSNPASLHRELACARYLLQRAVDKNEIHLAATLLSTLGKISKSAERAAIRSNDLLARNTVISIAQDLLQCVVFEMQDVDGWEEKIDRISAAFVVAIEKADNGPSALLE